MARTVVSDVTVPKASEEAMNSENLKLYVVIRGYHEEQVNIQIPGPWGKAKSIEKLEAHGPKIKQNISEFSVFENPVCLTVGKS